MPQQDSVRNTRPQPATASQVAGGTAPAHAQTRVERALAWASAERVDLAIVIAITAVAAALRLWRLGSVPLGLHGDEAWTGIDARRILDEGWIGPYVISALGQPTGPLYATAALFKVLPQDTFTLRFSMAIFGIATVPLAYALFASMYNRTVAAFAAAILAGMMWHLHLSRTGFMVTTQPFMELLVLLVLWQAMRRRNTAWFVAAGALFGLGIYSYNAYTLFLPIPFVALAVEHFHVPRVERARHILRSLAFALAAVVVAIPMIVYVISDYHTYHVHQEVVGLTDSQQWHDASIAGKPKLVWDRAVEWQEALVLGDRPDLGDGLATENHPVVEPLIYVLAIAGLVIGLWRVRQTGYAIPVAAAAILPWGALLTVDDGLFRRTLGLAPFVALFAALPLAWLWQRALLVREPLRYFVLAAVLFAPVFAGVRATQEYFGPVQDDPYFKYVYPYQLDAASHYMDGLPKGTLVYFYSDRWPFDYETRRFEAPDVTGIDRSFEYRPQAIEVPLDFGADRSRDAVFILMGPYVDDLKRVTDRYGGGVIEEQTRDGEVLFRAYFLPAE
jgi:4-amino-4-deoxy-L-arabinose transferase-like glycosyltransferase